MTGPASPAAASLDVAGMRACAERLLAQDTEKLSSEEVEKLTLRLRGQVGLIVREIECLPPRPAASRSSTGNIPATAPLPWLLRPEATWVGAWP